MADENTTVPIQIRVFTDDRETYYGHVFHWEPDQLLDFFPFAMKFIESSYSEYVMFQIEFNYEEPEGEEE